MEIVKKMAASLVDVGRIVRAARYSLSGLRVVIRTESAFRQELIALVVFAPLGLWLGRNGVERVLLVGSIVIVLIVELLNSAIEAVVNRIGTELHLLSGHAKDMGSAAVFLSILLAVAVWLLLLADRFGIWSP